MRVFGHHLVGLGHKCVPLGVIAVWESWLGWMYEWFDLVLAVKLRE